MVTIVVEVLVQAIVLVIRLRELMCVSVRLLTVELVVREVLVQVSMMSVSVSIASVLCAGS